MGFVNEKCFRKFAILAIISCLATYTFVYHDYIADRIMYTTSKLQNAYFVNLPGCRMMALQVMNPTIATFVDDNVSSLSCNQISWFRARARGGQWFLEFILTLEKHKLLFNVNKINCSYWPMERKPKDDYQNVAGNEVPLELNPPYSVMMPTGIRFVKVICRNFMNFTLYQDVHFFEQPPPGNLLTKYKLELNSIGNENKNGQHPLISVMILGLDSVSHMNFVRQMTKTKEFIRRQIPHVEFWGYNKIESDTYSTLIPLLSGLNVKEFEKLCYYPNRNQSFDNCPLIWKDYKKAGYNTSFAEDNTEMGIFNYLRTGFEEQPTDHYMRPILLAANKLKMKKSNDPYVNCAGGRTYGDMLLEQIDQLMPHMQRNPFFSFYWWSQGLHDEFNFPHKIDGRFHRLLYKLNLTGIMNNTFILFMSGHGIRWGKFRRTYQGMLEDYQPLLFAFYPKWLKKRYPLAFTNLEHNHRSLITTFDLHDTLVNLLDLKTLEDDVIRNKTEKLWKLTGDQMPRSASLFLPVSPWRTCNISQIASPYCLCHNLTPVATDDDMVKRSGRIIVNSINNILKPFPQCQKLKLKAIVNAYKTSLSKTPKTWLTQYNAEMEFKVRLQTVPGDAFFESTTRIKGYKLMLVDEISRVGGKHNYMCHTDDPLAEMYCYCILSN